MLEFIFKRLLWMLLTLWVVFTLSFFLMRAVPGGPFDGDRRLAPEISKNIQRRYHLDEPLYQQYLRELKNVFFRVDLGHSYKLGDYTVNRVIARRPADLGGARACWHSPLRCRSGSSRASRRQLRRGSIRRLDADDAGDDRHRGAEFRRRRPCDHVVRVSDSDFSGRRLGLVRSIGAARTCASAPRTPPTSPASRAPACSTCCRKITFAPPGPKGSAARVSFGAMRCRRALLPVVSYLGPAAAYILTGSLVIEQIFAIPGLGSHFVEAALQRDYTLAMGCVLLYTVILFTMNMLVDLSYTILDPRVELD